MMLIEDMNVVGQNLLLLRKKNGLTQSEVAEKAGVSDRAYAEIERGTVNMRVCTLINLCKALKTTPDQLLTVDEPEPVSVEECFEKIQDLSIQQKKNVIELISVYLKALSE